MGGCRFFSLESTRLVFLAPSLAMFSVDTEQSEPAFLKALDGEFANLAEIAAKLNYPIFAKRLQEALLTETVSPPLHPESRPRLIAIIEPNSGLANPVHEGAASLVVKVLIKARSGDSAAFYRTILQSKEAPQIWASLAREAKLDPKSIPVRFLRNLLRGADLLFFYRGKNRNRPIPKTLSDKLEGLTSSLSSKKGC